MPTLIRLVPADTTQQLLDTLKSEIPGNPTAAAAYSFAVEIVSGALNGIQPKNMRDVLKVIPGGKSGNSDI